MEIIITIMKNRDTASTGLLEIDQVCIQLFSLSGDVIWTEKYNIVVIKMFLCSSESGDLFLD